jgi:hypothetical protein
VRLRSVCLLIVCWFFGDCLIINPSEPNTIKARALPRYRGAGIYAGAKALTPDRNTNMAERPASLAILRLHFGGKPAVVLMKASVAYMARWSSQCRLFAVAFVALACSGSDVHAFVPCKDCPERFASTPIAQRAALPPQRAQNTHVHDRYVDRRWHQIRRDDPWPPSLARRTAFTAFAAVTMDSGVSEPRVSSAITDPAPAVANAAMPATPAFRIDELFNIMAAGPSDEPEEVAALRSNMLSQFRLRQSFAGPDNRTGYLVPTIIAFGGGLLIGAVLISAKSQAFGLPRISGRQRRRRGPTLLSDRARRLGRRMSGNALEGPTVSPGVREPVTGLLNHTGSTPAGAWPRWGDERSRA